MEAVAAEALLAGSYGSSTVRYVQDLENRPPPPGAMWKSVKVG